MRFIYLEGGSGVKHPVPPEMIRKVKNHINIPLIVGGGIRSRETAVSAVSAGADVIVTGNIIEGADSKQKISEIIGAFKRIKS
jgi:phosphoglycerol geranylgeranyltransferase